MPLFPPSQILTKYGIATKTTPATTSIHTFGITIHCGKPDSIATFIISLEKLRKLSGNFCLKIEPKLPMIENVLAEM